MKERFEGDAGRVRLAEALREQKSLKAGASIIDDLVSLVEVRELPPGKFLITEDAADHDAYFILAGKFSILVKGNLVAERGPGDLVGEMSAIESSLPRSADVIAKEVSVVAKLSSDELHGILEKCPEIWKHLAKELAKRLHQRNGALQKPNPSPQVFIISSAEALPIAREIQSALGHDATVTLWTNGVFFASDYPVDSLEAAVDQSDFAIAVAQPDDTSISRSVESKIARDNVIFELGLFMGRLGRKRTILFQPKGQELKLPSDLLGLTPINYRIGRKEEMAALIGTACNEARKVIETLGVRKSRYGN